MSKELQLENSSNKAYKSSQPKTVQQSLTDSYLDNRAAGRTIGTHSPSGGIRKGVDVEKLIAIDNGALRFQPLATSGWGRQGIAYGPYQRTNGLAFAAFLLNGHNASKPGMGQSLDRRLLRWALGNDMENPARRLLRWVASPQSKGMGRRIVCWAHNTPKRLQRLQIPIIQENLAVGWFESEVPANPTTEGNALIVHETKAENGELWTRIGTNLLPAFKGLQNLQVYYIVVLREKGAAYYAASVVNAHGLGAYPNMRPIAIDPFNEATEVYAGIYQSALGEVGFRVDTRIYGARVEQIPELASWYGTAHAADRLLGNGLLDGSESERGGVWSVYDGSYKLTASGASPADLDSLAVLRPATPSGLIHTLIQTSETITDSSLIWRFQDESNCWRFLLKKDACQLQIKEDGVWTSVAASDEWCLEPNFTNSVQVLDDGETFSLYLNGKLVFNTWFTDKRLQNATGVGFSATEANPNLYVRAFEAHPKSVPIPPVLDLGSPWLADGTQAVLTDDFVGEARDLAGKLTSTGDKVWRKEMGAGLIELTGSGRAKVRASVQNPNPGRTAYTIDWDYPEFADLQVDITPPGSKTEKFSVASNATQSQGDKGRSGLIFWQDADNYITINNCVDQNFFCASISSFFYLNGFEEIFDAVWSNVGSKVYWGNPYTLRIVFDGMNYAAFVNGEPVLYRALTDIYPNAKRLSINRVGILANWEWGNDTGSVFNNFVARV
jgi:hypothetical protein